MPEFTGGPEPEPTLEEQLEAARQEADRLSLELAEAEAEYEAARAAGDFHRAEDVKPARAIYESRIAAAQARADELIRKLGNNMQDIQDIASKHRGEDE